MKVNKNLTAQIVVTTEVETLLYPNISIECSISCEWKTVNQNIWHLLKALNVNK